jgi:hypothetical protein
MGFFEGKSRWIAGVVAGLGIGAAVEQGMKPELKKDHDATEQTSVRSIHVSNEVQANKKNDTANEAAIAEVRKKIEGIGEPGPKLVEDADQYMRLGEQITAQSPHLHLEKAANNRNFIVKENGINRFVNRYVVKNEKNDDPLAATVGIKIMSDGTYVVETVTGFDKSVIVKNPADLKKVLDVKFQLAAMKSDEMNAENPADQQAIRDSMIAEAHNAGIELNEELVQEDVAERENSQIENDKI